MGELYDAPNQQSVRADGSGPGDEGTGGAAGEPRSTVDLDKMTKAELLAHARAGATPANEGMTKDELRAAIEEAGG